MEKKYGLQLRVKPSQQKPPRPPVRKPLGFRDGDDDDNVEGQILRQAYKNKSLKDVEEQHKKALEEDPSAFDYDGVYDDMKQKIARPIAHDKLEKKPKYIETLIEKAKQRERESEIVYERKLAKERGQEDHLYADKDKFVTSAYKKKLAEQAKWMQEERLRQLLEEKEDVTKKKDMTDFYFGLDKNVAFGGGEAALRKSEKQSEEVVTKSPEKVPPSRNAEPEASKVPPSRNAEPESSKVIERHENDKSHEADSKSVSNASTQETAINEPTATEQPRDNHHKRSQETLMDAKQRFLARKKVKDQQRLSTLE